MPRNFAIVLCRADANLMERRQFPAERISPPMNRRLRGSTADPFATFALILALAWANPPLFCELLSACPHLVVSSFLNSPLAIMTPRNRFSFNRVTLMLAWLCLLPLLYFVVFFNCSSSSSSCHDLPPANPRWSAYNWWGRLGSATPDSAASAPGAWCCRFGVGANKAKPKQTYPNNYIVPWSWEGASSLSTQPTRQPNQRLLPT